MQTAEAPPSRPAAVYRLWARDGALLYVGSSYRPEARYQERRRKPWGPQIARCAEEWHPSRADAFRLELEAIAGEYPRYNVYGTGRETDALRARTAASRARGAVQSEAYRLEREVIAEAQEAGAGWREAYLLAQDAFTEYLDRSGLFPDWVARLRKRRPASEALAAS
ncbi:hypothetical protein ACFC09_15350 [Streptomyces sp. NPDC056161]|uniref:hypothetical protein n=1 Tax=Streptomyces sp. NPDC056161 TaxID=3345732 RepID=UPI0035DA9F2B